MRAREFARRNAGVAAAAGAYGLLAAGGVIAVQHMAHPISPPTAILPASPAPSPSQSPSTRPVAPSPSPSVDISRTLVAAEPARRNTAAGIGRPSSGGAPGGGVRSKAPSKPTPKPTSQPPQPSRCPSGRIVAVQEPLGVLPCGAVRVGDAVTIGGMK